MTASRLERLRKLENRYTGPIPKEELARLSGAEPEAVRTARGNLKWWEKELNQALFARASLDAADPDSYSEADYQQIASNITERIEHATREATKARAHLASLVGDVLLAAE